MKKLTKRLVSLLLAASLMMSSLTVLAEEDKSNEPVAGGNAVVEESIAEGETTNEAEAELPEEAADEAEAEIPEEATNEVEAELPDETASEVKARSTLKASYIYEVNYEQKEINKKDITVSIPNVEKVISMKAADSVQIEAKLLYKNKVMQSVKKNVKLNDLAESGDFTVEFPTYGKYWVTTTFYKEGAAVKTTAETVVGVTAEEYNLATLNATFPVVQFTLSLWDMKGDSENPVPTYISVSRNDAYDWDKLPENVYDLPYINDSNRESVGFTNKIYMTADFIKELYELNPDSKFNFYCVDYTLTSMLYTLIENQIPKDQYSVRILSDGTASYAYFNERFNNANPRKVYNELAAEWAGLRKEFEKGKRVSLSSLKYATSADTSSLKYYTYVIANEEKKAGVDIEWWLARTNGTLLSEDSEFLAEACREVEQGGVIRLTAFNKMLLALQEKGKAVEKEFKDLYHFSETMFELAEKSGKKAMMLLGTRVTGEADFEDYARFCMLYYGDDYVYYYKGHPATPTAMYPEKQAQLNNLGMHDVESSIAAELILYFYPNISMSGYDSSTFISANEEMACCLFNMSLESAYNVTNGCDYKNTIDFCLSKITDYNSGIGKKLNKDHRNYLIEFNKVVSDSPYDIGVWDATDSCIYYYVLNNGEYVLKSKELATRPVVSAEGGQNEIKLTWSKVLGAEEYRIYRYDEKTKEYTGVSRTKGTTCTFKGLKDGTKYTYLVRAKVGGIWSKYSTANHVSAYTICAKPIVKVTPQDNAVKLSWKAVPGATQYRVYQYDGYTKKYTKIEDTEATSVTYKGLSDGETYTYLVRAKGESGFSSYKRTDNVDAITLCKKPQVVANETKNSIKLTWKSVPGATKYRVYKYNATTKQYTGIANVTGNSYTFKNLKAGTKYFYLVRAYNGQAYSAYTANDIVNCKTICDAPSVSVKAGKSSVKISWSAVKGATKYRVYEYNTATKKYTRLFDTTKTSWTESGLKKGTTRRYLVRAYNGTTFSAYSTSNIVKGTAK